MYAQHRYRPIKTHDMWFLLVFYLHRANVRESWNISHVESGSDAQSTKRHMVRK